MWLGAVCLGLARLLWGNCGVAVRKSGSRWRVLSGARQEVGRKWFGARRCVFDMRVWGWVGVGKIRGSAPDPAPQSPEGLDRRPEGLEWSPEGLEERGVPG
ncbi:hypothetical protein GCM10010431_52200 [Streptomyces kunmingensis]